MTDGIPASREARDRLFVALREVGFGEDLYALLRECPPPTHEFEAAFADPGFRGHVERLARAWDLDAPWFHREVHAVLWNAVGGDKDVRPAFPWLRAWAALDVNIALRPLLAEALEIKGPQTHYLGRALWADTSKEEVWDEIRAVFDRFWDQQVEPLQREQPGYRQRNRSPQNLLRDARAYALRAKLHSRYRGDALYEAVADELRDRYGIAVEAASLSRALSRFSGRLRSEEG